MTLTKQKALYVKAKEAYYNSKSGKPIMTDAEFDKLEESIAKQDPNWKELKSTGVLGKKSDVEFEYLMPSLSKVTNANPDKVNSWCQKYLPGTVTAKLDGSSLQATYQKGKLIELATRGNGVVGKSIMHLAPYISIPKSVVSKETLVVRGEALMSKKAFALRWSMEFVSDRAAVSGILNRQSAHKALADVDFVAFRILNSRQPHQSQMTLLEDLGFAVPHWDRLVKASSSMLNGLLESIRESYKYTVDGLVLYTSNPSKPGADRPKDVIAYKLNDVEGLLTKVLDVEWKHSAFGQVIPKAVIEPLDFDGVTVKQVALHNARWMLDQGIDKGALVRVIRSGDIIPKIIHVEKSVKVNLPKQYTWDTSKVHLLGDVDDSAKYTRLFKLIGLEHAGTSAAQTAAKTFDSPAQFLASLGKNGKATVAKIASAGVAKRILEAFDQSKVDMASLMVATGFFDRGVGTTRINSLLDNGLFELLSNYVSKKPVSKNDVDWYSVGKVAGEQIVQGMPNFLKWLNKNPSWLNKPVAKKAPKSGKLNGLAVSFTGYRSKEEEAWIADNGGQVVPFGSKTQVLLYKAGGKASSKVEKARAKGIRACNFEELK